MKIRTVLGVAMMAGYLAGCLLGKTVAKTAIDVALATCVAENPGADEKELQAACQFADDVLPIVRQLLAAQKKGAAKGAARDGGACASGVDAGH